MHLTILARILSDRKLLDNVFSARWVTKQYAKRLSFSTERFIQTAVNEWHSSYWSSSSFALATLRDGQYRDALDLLSKVPWLGSLIDDFEDKDAFDILDVESLGLREYAISVADGGYNGNGECIDHAIASGLFLLQYTSFWYWILNYLKDTNEGAYLEAAGGYDYDILNLKTDFIPACRAVAFHNVLPVSQNARNIINSLSLNQYPLVYLSILCDEIQRWEPLSFWDQLLRRYTDYARSSLESNDLSLACFLRPRSSFLRAQLLVDNSVSQGAVLIRSSLAERLPDYKNILEVGVFRRRSM